MKRSGALGGFLGISLTIAIAVVFFVWGRLDRQWLLTPPPGRWNFIVRVDGTSYQEGLATLLMLDLAQGTRRETSHAETGASRQPLRMWVTHSFPPRPADDGAALLADVRKKVEARLAKDPYRWKVAWVDDQGRSVIVSGPADR